MTSLAQKAAPEHATLVGDILAVLSEMFPTGAALHEPEFHGNEWSYIKECLDTGWVSTAGQYVERFEEELQRFTGSPYAVATVNGTSALHACLLLAGVESSEEVILPALSFVATANAVRYCGAEPHFADIEEMTLGLDSAALAQHLAATAEVRGDACINRQTGRRIRAAICMHTFGHPVEIDPLVELCRRFNLTLIEDAAESLGSTYKGRHTGTIAPLAALSFNGNKIATTGGGGAILTGDSALADRARHLTTTAKTPHPFEFLHDEVGFNYRMPNINAAIGCAQLERLPQFLKRKRSLAERYGRAFADVSGARMFTEALSAHSNNWLNVLLLDREHSEAREAILSRCNEAGIMARAAWVPLHRLAMYENCPAMALPVTERTYARAIVLPSSPSLMEDEDHAS